MDQIQVWDTAGQERFRTITQSYYRSAHGAVIAYDITRQATFDSVSHWIKEVELYGASNVVLVLIGEKPTLQSFLVKQLPTPACLITQATNVTWNRNARSHLRMLATWQETEAC